ncbi:MAG: 4-alpha-glucanotransferase, partial [Poseidonibacter sp.]
MIKNGIKIIGDIPIYAAEDSADVWADNNIFLMNENKTPIKV